MVSEAPVVDSQVHVWLPESPARPWPPGGREWARASHRATPISGDQLIREMDEVGVDRAVLVPPLFEGYRNDYALSCAQAHPDRFRVMARLDLRRQDLAGELERLAAHELVAGVRLVFLPVDAGRIEDSAADRLWPVAERLDLPLMVFAPGQHRELREVARAHPSLRMALDHLNLSGEVADLAVAGEIGPLLELAEYDQFAVKASCLPTYSTEPYPHPALHPAVRRVLDAFGPDRVFWGSDLSRLRGTYEAALRMVRDEVLAADEQAEVFGAAISRWTGWPSDGAARPASQPIISSGRT